MNASIFTALPIIDFSPMPCHVCHALVWRHEALPVYIGAMPVGWRHDYDCGGEVERR